MASHLKAVKKISTMEETSTISRFLFYEDQELVLGPKRKKLSDFVHPWKGPLYVYDLDFIKARFDLMKKALKKTRIYYAMKANSHPEVLKYIKSLGAGVDVVSLGEIQRVLECGFNVSDIVYSGVGKTKHEISEALRLGIFQINVESFPELQRIAQLAASLGKVAEVSLRLNPDVDIDTHPYIATGLRDNKFGVEISLLPDLIQFFRSNANNLKLVGISMHLGSQMFEFDGLSLALQKLKTAYLQLQSYFPSVQRFDFGGGLGILYDKQDLVSENQYLENYAEVIFNELSDIQAELQSEPGRWLIGHAGVLISQVQYIKKTSFKNFLIVDTGMNHLIRPALYNSYHHVWSLKERTQKMRFEIVGPICESADFIGKNREICQLEADEFIVIQDAGAYGASMASTYNLQSLPREIVI